MMCTYLLHLYTDVLIKTLLHWEEKKYIVVFNRSLVKPETVLAFFSSNLLGKFIVRLNKLLSFTT